MSSHRGKPIDKTESGYGLQSYSVGALVLYITLRAEYPGGLGLEAGSISGKYLRETPQYGKSRPCKELKLEYSSMYCSVALRNVYLTNAEIYNKFSPI